jgi:3',5'-cyclic-AMP phosphodiesterase
MTLPLAWVTDAHLNMVASPRALAAGWGKTHGTRGLLLTGDIAEGQMFPGVLDELVEGYGGPVYFVLGNHDLWHTSRQKIHRALSVEQRKEKGWHWLRERVVDLGDGTFLTGADGWYDMRVGNPHSPFWIRDWDRVEELGAVRQSKEKIVGVSRQWAREEARRGLTNINAAISGGARRILFATHIPPFPEISLYEGKESPDGLPYYTSIVMGEMLSQVASAHPKISFEVYSGHTHERARMIRGNLTAEAGESHYRSPQVTRTIAVGAPGAVTR